MKFPPQYEMESLAPTKIEERISKVSTKILKRTSSNLNGNNS